MRPVSGSFSNVKTGMRAILSLATYLFVVGLGIFMNPCPHAFGATAIGEILPLGDSITDGWTVAGGYRAQLYSLLSNAGDSFNFVGSSTNNSTAALTAAGQQHHEGHSGYRIDQIDGNLTGLVSSDPVDDTSNGGHWFDGGHDTGHAAIYPDLILLHIGTNDADQGLSAAQMQSSLQSLLTTIRSNRPNAKVIVASLIPRTDNPNVEAVQVQYNNAVPGIVGAQGPNFHFVDMHSVIQASDLADGIHPNQGGYDKMAVAWANALHGFAAVEPLRVVTAISRKTHGPGGNFDLNLPLTGAPAVECRTGGTNRTCTLLFNFSNNVTSGSAAVTTSSGTVSGSPTFAGNVMSVSLANVANAQRLRLTLTNVTDPYAQMLASTAINMNVLLGDTTGDGMVNATDVSQAKLHVGSIVGAANFRADITVDNSINSSDISNVRLQSGTALP